MPCDETSRGCQPEHSILDAKTYKVWYRNPDAVISVMLGNPDFNGQFDLHPYVNLNPDGTCQWNNVMSGNLAWRNSVCSVLIAIFFDVQYIDLVMDA